MLDGCDWVTVTVVAEAVSVVVTESVYDNTERLGIWDWTVAGVVEAEAAEDEDEGPAEDEDEGATEDEGASEDADALCCVNTSEVMTCVIVEAGGISVMVVGAADVTVNTMVEGVSDSVTTIVDSCVVSRVCVRVTASVTVVAGASFPAELPPSTATTEYEAGFLRAIESGMRGRALARRSRDDKESDVRIGREAILVRYVALDCLYG